MYTLLTYSVCNNQQQDGLTVEMETENKHSWTTVTAILLSQSHLASKE